MRLDLLPGAIQMQSTTLNEFRRSTHVGLAVLALTAGPATLSRAQAVDAHLGRSSVPWELPLSFEPNRGQSEEGVRFVARGPGYILYLNEEGSSFQFSATVGSSAGRAESLFTVKLAGQGKSRSSLFGLDQQLSKSSYFTGSDPKKWLTDIPNFSRVTRYGVYEGIDVTYGGSQGRLECEFKIAPHAKPGIIALEINGADHLRGDARGDLVFTVANAEMRLHRPTVYQEVNGASHKVAWHYVVRGNLITLRVGIYDPDKILFIRPALSYSGFLKLQDASSVPTERSHRREPIQIRSRPSFQIPGGTSALLNSSFKEAQSGTPGSTGCSPSRDRSGSRF
jgi:predicted DNA-binding protein (UPF0251 family)